jgi:hypothetical protein
MPFIAAPVELPDSIRTVLTHISHSQTLPSSQVQRSKIILLAASGLNNNQISAEVNLGQDSVSKWRSRYIKEQPYIEEVLLRAPDDLDECIKAFLMDLPRPGQPKASDDLSSSTMCQSKGAIFIEFSPNVSPSTLHAISFTHTFAINTLSIIF